MHAAAARAIDEVGFHLILALLGLRQHRRQPEPGALEALRRDGSPLVPPPLDAPPVPDVTIEEVADPHTLEPDLRVRFPSPSPSPWTENNTVHMDVYRPGAHWGSGIVLGYPGVLTGASKINEFPFRMFARAATRRGLSFALMHPPYHMARTPPGFTSGALMFSGDVFTAGQGFVQSTWDAKAAVSWALTHVPRVGYWGASMGGVMGLLLAAREPRLHCCIPMIPAADMVGPLFQSTLCRVLREDLVAAGGTAADLHALMAPLDPFTNPPVIARDRLLLIESLYDRVCFPEDLERLWQAWDCPPILRYPQGHLSIFQSRECMRDMLNFLQTYLTGPALLAPAAPALLSAAA